MWRTDVALDYLHFVEERHRIWEARQAGEPGPWTRDSVLAAHKFTNVFRVLDPGSQFVFELDNTTPSETLMRLFLYRHTGRIDAWREVRAELGEWPSFDNLAEVELIWKLWRESGLKVFTSAYLVYPQSATKGSDKVESIVRLVRRLFVDEGLAAYFLAASSQAERFSVLRRNKGVADFMSMQVLTDWGYTQHVGEDLEDSFVVCGPGARRGAAALYPGRDPRDVVEWAQRSVHELEDCPEVQGRKPSAMDIQNTLCEFSKRVRYQSKPVPARAYVPAHPGPQAPPILPSHWA